MTPPRVSTVVSTPGTSMRIPSDTFVQFDEAGIWHAKKPMVFGGRTSPASPCMMTTSSCLATSPLTVLKHSPCEHAKPLRRSEPALTVPITKPRLDAVAPGLMWIEHCEGNKGGCSVGDGIGYGEGDGVGLPLICMQYLSASWLQCEQPLETT